MNNGDQLAGYATQLSLVMMREAQTGERRPMVIATVKLHDTEAEIGVVLAMDTDGIKHVVDNLISYGEQIEAMTDAELRLMLEAGS